MKIVVTCGPSYEPIDGARRMTNMSAGKLCKVSSPSPTHLRADDG